MKERATQGEVEERRLENEYLELCKDWWQRDRYVIDKLSAAGILFGILALAVGNIPPDRPLIKLFLLFAGALFSVILCISVAKDTLYRDGTEALLTRLAAKLRITNSLKDLEHLRDSEPPVGFDDGLDFQELRFPRKIKISSDHSSLRVFPGRLRNWFQKRATFKWILSFYIVSFGIFVILFVLVLLNWIYGLNLPI